MQDSGNNNPPKKPAADSGEALYLRSRLKQQLEQCDRGPISREDFETKWEYLRELGRRIRQGGRLPLVNPWPPLIFGASMFVLFVGLAHRESSRDYSYTSPEWKFQILRRFDASNFLVRRIHNTDGRITKDTIHVVPCPGYTVNWSAGETLTRITYRDLESCWYFQSKGLGWDYEIGPDGHDTLAPNCHEGPQIVECSPNLTEANFPEE